MIRPYNFSSLHINTDYAIGVSHACKITFELCNEGSYGAAHGAIEFDILAIPTLDGNNTSSLDRLQEIISKIKN